VKAHSSTKWDAVGKYEPFSILCALCLTPRAPSATLLPCKAWFSPGQFSQMPNGSLTRSQNCHPMSFDVIRLSMGERERERGWRQPQKSNRTNAKCWYRAEITIDEKQHGYITCASACTLLISFDLFPNYPHHGPHLATFLGDAFESFCIASLNKVSRKGKSMALSFCHNGFRLFGQTGLYSGSA